MINFVAIDFETANENHGSACAMGLAVVQNGEITEVQSWRIRPPEHLSHFTPWHTRVHGMTESDVQNELTFEQLWPAISGYFIDHTIVAHGAASTEMSILRSLFEHYKIDPPDFQFACTLKISKLAWPGKIEGYGLQKVAEHLGTTFEHHLPEEDAKACAMIVHRACQLLEVESFEELAQQLHCVISSFSMERAITDKSESSAFSIAVVLDLNLGDVEREEVAVGSGVYCADLIRQACGDERAFSKGNVLFNKKQIISVSKTAWELKASVAGSGKDAYQVTINGALKGTCTCPAWKMSKSRFCKHVVALALAWESEGGPKLKSDIEQTSADELKQLLLSRADTHPELLYKLITGES